MLYDRSPYIIGIDMRMIRECRHCGREFHDMNNAFCSDECAKEAS
ncbi:MAG: hypothetical protein ACE5EJ_04755 [Nitrosopumilaceae archaeon]